jgi:hypothetical protein
MGQVGGEAVADVGSGRSQLPALQPESLRYPRLRIEVGREARAGVLGNSERPAGFRFLCGYRSEPKQACGSTTKRAGDVKRITRASGRTQQAPALWHCSHKRHISKSDGGLCQVAAGKGGVAGISKC